MMDQDRTFVWVTLAAAMMAAGMKPEAAYLRADEGLVEAQKRFNRAEPEWARRPDGPAPEKS